MPYILGLPDDKETLMRPIDASPRPAAAGGSRAPHRIGVVLVDPLHTIRSGVSLLISSEPDMEVLGEAGSGDEALSVLRGLRRKSRIVVIVGLGLAGDHDSFWLIRGVREAYPGMTILAWGADDDQVLISRALFVGADGFAHKRSLSDTFLDGIRRSITGEVVLVGLPPDALGELALGIEQHRDAEQVLTGRELQVLSVASEGLTARQIGRRLGVRERTVTTHLGRIYKKLGASGRDSALATASRHGLVMAVIRE